MTKHITFVEGECVHDMAWRYQADITQGLECVHLGCVSAAIDILGLLGWTEEEWVLAVLADDRTYLGECSCV